MAAQEKQTQGKKKIYTYNAEKKHLVIEIYCWQYQLKQWITYMDTYTFMLL